MASRKQKKVAAPAPPASSMPMPSTDQNRAQASWRIDPFSRDTNSLTNVDASPYDRRAVPCKRSDSRLFRTTTTPAAASFNGATCAEGSPSRNRASSPSQSRLWAMTT